MTELNFVAYSIFTYLNAIEIYYHDKSDLNTELIKI